MKRPPEDEVERRFPASQWITCTGSPGTMIFCDTFGIHRGGVSTTGARVLATWAFVTPASLHGHRFRVDRSSLNSPTAPARFALLGRLLRPTLVPATYGGQSFEPLSRGAKLWEPPQWRRS